MTITSNKDEQKLDNVIGILNGSTVDPPVKQEDDGGPALAMATTASRFGSGGRRGGVGGGHSGGHDGHGYGSGNHGNGSGGSGGAPHGDQNSDDKGYHWCDPTNENHCHRCGRSGHIAARCIHNMPQHIKDWVMNNSSRERSHAAAESAHHLYGLELDYVGSKGDDRDGRQYYNNVEVPFRI
ncbi:hypothetical protein C8R44DRAFT_808560 [Mycena epipterygia]|nr:hypothetical protein C8R44DRAFT_808560 [Mycena epipterygia]